MAVVVVEIVEEVLLGMFHGKTLAQSMPQIGGGGLEGILLVGPLLFVVLIPLFAFMELRQLLGHTEFHSLFFEERKNVGKRAA
jgi:hypothetical protein